MRNLVITVLLVLAFVFSASPANATTFGDTARAVAVDINCTNFDPEPHGVYAETAGNCLLDGRRFHIVTFAGPVKQNHWHMAMVEQSSLGDFWAESRGVAMGSLTYWFTDAEAAANALNGQIFHGTFFLPRVDSR